LNNHWIIEELRKDIQKILKCKENENTAYHDLCDTVMAVFKRKFATMSTYTEKVNKQSGIGGSGLSS
jgi:hypothetical protein